MHDIFEKWIEPLTQFFMLKKLNKYVFDSLQSEKNEKSQRYLFKLDEVQKTHKKESHFWNKK